jgi:indoleacetamide hydrolase
MMMTPVAQMLGQLRAGEVTARGLVEASLAAEQANRHLNSFITVDDGGALAAATAADAAYRDGRARPLEGVPIAVKDNLAVAGLPFTGGSKALGATPADRDAGVVAALRAAGAIIIGKTGLHEFAFGVTSNNGAFGPIGNPAAADRASGGSSGGAAAAVAAGIVPVCLGTDTGGSGRIPASFCGCTGYRPTTARYPVSGVMQLTWTLDSTAVLAASVRDLELVDAVLTGQDARFQNANPPSPSGIRLGVPRSSFANGCAPAVSTAFNRALERLSAAGVHLVDVDLAGVMVHDQAAAFPIALFEARQLWLAELARHGLSPAQFIGAISSPDVRDVFTHMLGEGIALPDYFAAMNDHLVPLRHSYAHCFAAHSLDAVVFPTVPVTAPPLGEDRVVRIGSDEHPLFPTIVRNTSPGSLAGIPGISIPCGLAEGLPFGLEIDGPQGSDKHLMMIARILQETVFANTGAGQ